MGYIYYDRKIVDESEVNISVRCVALNYGLGCFEGIRAYYDSENDKHFGFLFKEHYERFLNSCKLLNIKINHTVEELCNITVELIKKNNMKCNIYVRPLAFKGANALGFSLKDDENDKFTIFLTPLDKFIDADTMDVCVSSYRRLSDNAIPARVKSSGSYINSALASYEAELNGYHEAILLREDGNVAEGPGENIFLVRGNKIITPDPSQGILEGITRNLVIRLAKEELNMEVEERSVARSELYSSEEVFFSGTAMQVACIVSIDRRVIGNGGKGPVFNKINELFSSITLGKNEKYKDCTIEISY